MNYNNYHYIYPPRPKNPAPPEDLARYDTGMMIAQPKLNGSNSVIFTNGIEWKILNRHNDRLSNFHISAIEMSDNLFKCERGKWMVLNGECLNKSKNDENGLVFNQKLIIFDILVFNSVQLIGKTFSERIKLMDDLFGTEESEKKHLLKISQNIYRVKSYESGFVDLYNDLVKTDMMEGLVLKRKNARLELGLTENNNHKSQIKVRKISKNYKF